MAGDINRLRLAGRYLLVMTPDDFLKRTPGGVTHVPMEHVTDLRLVGVRVAQHEEDLDSRTRRYAVSRARVKLLIGTFLGVHRACSRS